MKRFDIHFHAWTPNFYAGELVYTVYCRNKGEAQKEYEALCNKNNGTIVRMELIGIS